MNEAKTSAVKVSFIFSKTKIPCIEKNTGVYRNAEIMSDPPLRVQGFNLPRSLQ